MIARRTTPARAGSLLLLEDLVVRSGDGRRVVGPVSLRVSPGERVAVIGASGAGKSLLAAAVAGLLPPGLGRSGTVVCDTVAVVAQDSTSVLNPLVRIGPQLSRPLRRRGFAAPARRREVVRLLAATGLEHPAGLVDRFPAELSGGQRQRVCLALALACRAGLLVADEPTTALDVVTEREVLALLAAVPATLLLITHDLAAAARWCDRVVVVEDGQVVEDGSVEEVLTAPRHPRTRALVDAVPTVPLPLTSSDAG